MSKSFSTASNVAYVLRAMRRGLGWGAVAACAADVALGVALPFLGAALPSFVVGVLASGMPAPAALGLLAAYVAAYQLARVLQAWTANQRSGACSNTRSALYGAYLDALLAADYDYLQTEDARQGKGVAQACFFNGPDSGSQATLVRGQAAVSALSRRITERFSAQDGAWERRMVYFMDLIAGERADGKVERVFGMRDMLMGAFDQTNRASVGFYDRWRAGNRRVAVASTGVNGAFIVASYLIVAVKVLAGAITIGAFTQYAGALAQLGTAWSNLVSRNNDLREHCSYLEEFLAILDMPEASERGSIPPEKRDDGEYELAFEHVSFSYPGSSEEILHDVTLKLGMRRKMAVVGPNGTGKSTFIKLLCRLYRPTSGRITLNGIDIEKYDEDEYRDLMAVVFQDFRLFAFPVWENLAAGYARDDARLWAALDQADAGFVRAWPEGLETRLYNDLGQGVSPSGGQAQKLALARALYKDAPLVILDEPTAALDPISEAEVYEGFDRMVEGRTAVYISHRMSSCRFCDDLIVFDGGGVVERGGHEGLLAAGGLYARMWEAQASYYVDGEKNVGAQKS